MSSNRTKFFCHHKTFCDMNSHPPKCKNCGLGKLKRHSCPVFFFTSKEFLEKLAAVQTSNKVVFNVKLGFRMILQHVLYLFTKNRSTFKFIMQTHFIVFLKDEKKYVLALQNHESYDWCPVSHTINCINILKNHVNFWLTPVLTSL